MTKIYLDPRSRIRYSSFYIQGLWDVFGKKNVVFDIKRFSDLDRREEESFDHYMPFIIENADENKVIIDFRDKPLIKEKAYHWCDIYAKININDHQTDPKYLEKLYSIAPSFGIQLWNTPQSILHAIKNIFKSNFKLLTSYKNFFADYVRQSQRLKISRYLNNTETNENYVFMIATLWNHQNCIEGTNLLRKTFIEVCKKQGINFEGGFFAKSNHPQYDLVSESVFQKRYTSNDYIEKTKRSMVVFNTPAVHNCHGWKLGEYLMMGKAIISTPISNRLPESLIHEKNIYYISNADEMKTGLEKLIINPEIITQLERHAQIYAEKNVYPTSVINNICNEIQERKRKNASNFS